MGDQFERLEAGFGRKLNGNSTRFEHEASIPEMSVPEEPAPAANGESALGVPKSRWGFSGTLKGRSNAGGSASEDVGASEARRGGGLGRRRRSAAEKGGTESGDGVRRIKQAPAKHAPTLGTLNGVLIPTCEVCAKGLPNGRISDCALEFLVPPPSIFSGRKSLFASLVV
jgi:hypothetical protein